MSKGALARSVRPHDDVNFAALDREVNAVEDLPATGRRVQPFDLEQMRAHGSTTETVPSAITTWYTAMACVAGSEHGLPVRRSKVLP